MSVTQYDKDFASAEWAHLCEIAPADPLSSQGEDGRLHFRSKAAEQQDAMQFRHLRYFVKVVEACKKALPKVTLKFSDAESDALRVRVEAQTLDMALVFEDPFAPNFARHPIFRQRLYLVGREPVEGCRGVVSLEQVAKLPLV